MNPPSTPAAIGVLLVLLLGFLITDCSTGNVVHDEAIVTGRYYVPPRTEILVTVDEDGIPSFDDIDYPEEWHTVVLLMDNTPKDYNAGAGLYYSLTNGQFVTIRSKKGKWTGIKYIGEIQP